jgi:EpsI family protein
MLALAAAIVYAPLYPIAPEASPSFFSVPIALDGWTGTHGAPTEILPVDPRARETIPWTYRKGDRVVWVAVGRYNSRNDPQSRPSINLIVPDHGASRLSHAIVSLDLNGAGQSPIPISQFLVTRPTTRLSILYWYQLGPKAIAGEYRFRSELFLNTLLGRHESLALVRVATSAEPRTNDSNPGVAQEFLREFYPKLVQSLTFKSLLGGSMPRVGFR